MFTGQKIRGYLIQQLSGSELRLILMIDKTGLYSLEKQYKTKIMAKESKHHLEELSHKRYYDVADDDSDVRHWIIVDDSAKKIGEVKDLLFDPEAKKARYLITNLKDGMLEDDRRVLIPVGRARLNKEDQRVVLPTLTTNQIAGLPDYSSTENLTEEDEQKMRKIFAGPGEEEGETKAYDRKSFYEHEDFNEDRFHKRK